MALIELLKSGQIQKPMTITSAPKTPSNKVGFLLPSFNEGLLLLKNTEGQYFRLVWQNTDTLQKTSSDQERLRALPQGKYTLTNYTLIKKDKSNKEWYLSATSNSIRQITIKAGETQKISVAETIHIQGRSQHKKKGIQIQMNVFGEESSGLSLYCEGKRITFYYNIRSEQGNSQESGDIAYG